MGGQGGAPYFSQKRPGALVPLNKSTIAKGTRYDPPTRHSQGADLRAHTSGGGGLKMGSKAPPPLNPIRITPQGNIRDWSGLCCSATRQNNELSPITSSTVPCLERLLGHVTPEVHRLDPLRVPMAGHGHQPRTVVCARLRIPLSLIGTIPHTERHKLRAEVGLFRFRMI